MNSLKKYLFLSTLFITIISCSKDNDTPAANALTLQFDNTFGNTNIILGDAGSPTATTNTSAEGQTHHFSEIKYVISNIRLVKAEGGEIPYHINDLDKGATVIDQSKKATLQHVLSSIPAGKYKQIKFGLGVKKELNTLDQLRFPQFYATAGANDTKMMWEWGTGYRFTKLEGFYGPQNNTLSIHTGSTVEGTDGTPSSYTQGVDAYREITLTLPTFAVVGTTTPKITIKADFNNLLSGKINTIKLGEGNATPSIHTADNMVIFVDNLGGNGSNDLSGMFSIQSVEN